MFIKVRWILNVCSKNCVVVPKGAGSKLQPLTAEIAFSVQDLVGIGPSRHSDPSVTKILQSWVSHS